MLTYILLVVISGSTGTPVVKAEFKSKQDCEFFSSAANDKVRAVGHPEFVHYCTAK